MLLGQYHPTDILFYLGIAAAFGKLKNAGTVKFYYNPNLLEVGLFTSLVDVGALRFSGNDKLQRIKGKRICCDII